MNTKKIAAFDAETQRLQNEVDAFRKKFRDIEAFLKKCDDEVEKYFVTQTEFQEKSLFLAFLKKEIQFYVDHFALPRKQKVPIRPRLTHIENSYDKILYFGEFNPIEAQREKNSQPWAPEVENQRGYFGGKIKQVLHK